MALKGKNNHGWVIDIHSQGFCKQQNIPPGAQFQSVWNKIVHTDILIDSILKLIWPIPLRIFIFKLRSKQTHWQGSSDYGNNKTHLTGKAWVFLEEKALGKRQWETSAHCILSVGPEAPWVRETASKRSEEIQSHPALITKHAIYSVQFSRLLVSDCLWPHVHLARPPCPSPTPGVHPNSCSLSRWCHPTISSSIVLFSSCLQSFPTSGSFQRSQFFESGGQSIRVSASTSVLPMNTQDWSPLGWTGWISLQSKGHLRVFSNTTVQKHQFFGAQLSV